MSTRSRDEQEFIDNSIKYLEKKKLYNQLLKNRLKLWAKFATSGTETTSTEFNKMLKRLTREEMMEMLGYLSGFFGADQEGKKLCLRLME